MVVDVEGAVETDEIVRDSIGWGGIVDEVGLVEGLLQVAVQLHNRVAGSLADVPDVAQSIDGEVVADVGRRDPTSLRWQEDLLGTRKPEFIGSYESTRQRSAQRAEKASTCGGHHNPLRVVFMAAPG